MAMVGQRKMLKWSKEDMVLKANLFAREVPNPNLTSQP
jgi:hypothetical protein